jgi:hypothetical protein
VLSLIVTKEMTQELLGNEDTSVIGIDGKALRLELCQQFMQRISCSTMSEEKRRLPSSASKKEKLLNTSLCKTVHFLG